MTKDQLLAEFEDLLRSVPSNDALRDHSSSHFEWVGHAAAVVERWDIARTPSVLIAVDKAQSSNSHLRMLGVRALTMLLQQGRADLRMEVGKLSVVVAPGQVFEYFDELRKAIETARLEVFFVDPYLDAEFVGRYLPQVPPTVLVRLLAGKKMAALLPAVDIFAKQTGATIQVRSSTALHDRYLFVDRSACYLSGASFKDGAKNAPVTLTQIVDGFPAMFATYEGLWNAAQVERA